jgi:hypothetical protein
MSKKEPPSVVEQLHNAIAGNGPMGARELEIATKLSKGRVWHALSKSGEFKRVEPGAKWASKDPRRNTISKLTALRQFHTTVMQATQDASNAKLPHAIFQADDELSRVVPRVKGEAS